MTQSSKSLRVRRREKKGEGIGREGNRPPSLFLAWENSRHFVTATVVSPRNDVWQTSAEIPHWGRVTTQIWVVLLIGWSKFPTRQTHGRSKGLPTSGWVTRHQCRISALVSQTSFRPETTGGVTKCRLFCLVTLFPFAFFPPPLILFAPATKARD